MTSSPQTARTLAFPVRPHPGEDIVGLMARAAAENGYGSAVATASLAGTTVQEIRAGCARFEEIAAALGCPGQAADVAKAMPYRTSNKDWSNFHGTSIRNIYIAGLERRVSPTALREAPYLRAVWQVRPLAFDPQSMEMLIDRCPECRKPLGFATRHGVTHCHHCQAPDHEGFVRGIVDLRDYPQALVEPEDPEALTFATALIDPGASGIDRAMARLRGPFDQADRGELFDLVVRVARAFEASQATGRFKKYCYRGSIDPSSLAKAARAVLDWPASLEWLEAAFQPEGMERSFSAQAVFGKLFASLSLASPYELSCKAIREAMEHHLRLKRGYSAKSARNDLITKQGAERMYGVSKRSIRSWVRRDALATTRVGFVRGPVLMDRARLRQLVERRAAHVSRNKAAKLLGTQIGGLRSLVEAGFLVEAREWSEVSGQDPSILSASIDSMAGRLEAAARQTRPPSGCVSLNAAVDRACFMDDCLARAFLAACNGRLSVWLQAGPGGLFNRARVRSSKELEAAVRDTALAPPSGSLRPMSLREAGCALGTYSHTAAMLRSAGFLGERITRDDVLRFKAKYVLTREVVTRLKATGWKSYGSRVPKNFPMSPIARLDGQRMCVWLRAPMETAIRDGPEVLLPIAPYVPTRYDRAVQ